MNADLYRIFEYTPCDLDDLQQGRLSPTLRPRWHDPLRIMVIRMVLLVIAIGVFLLLAIRLPYALVGVAIGGPVMAWHIKDYRRLRRDMVAGEVRCLRDRFHTRPRPGHFFYMIDSQSRRYLITQWQYISLGETHGELYKPITDAYTIYYLPRSRRVVAAAH